LLFILNQTSLVKIFVSLLGCSVLRVSCSLASVQIKADSCRRFSLLALGFLTVAISSRFLHFTFPSAHGLARQVVLDSALRLAQSARQMNALR
jgi:hypothetical protein